MLDEIKSVLFVSIKSNIQSASTFKVLLYLAILSSAIVAFIRTYCNSSKISLSLCLSSDYCSLIEVFFSFTLDTMEQEASFGVRASQNSQKLILPSKSLSNLATRPSPLFKGIFRLRDTLLISSAVKYPFSPQSNLPNNSCVLRPWCEYNDSLYISKSLSTLI